MLGEAVAGSSAPEPIPLWPCDAWLSGDSIIYGEVERMRGCRARSLPLPCTRDCPGINQHGAFATTRLCVMNALIVICEVRVRMVAIKHPQLFGV